MKNTIFIATAFIIAIISISGYSQAPEPPQPKWATLNPDGEDFSVDVPAPVLKDELKVEKRGKKSSSVQYATSFGQNFFFIFSDKRDDFGLFDEAKFLIEEYNRTRVSGFPEGKYSTHAFLGDDGFFHRIAFIRTDSRTYTFHAASRDKDDQIAQRFLSTLIVGTISPNFPGIPENATPKAADRETTSEKPANKAQNDSVGANSGPGSGSGASGSMQAKMGTTDESSSGDKGTSKLKILSNPRPGYTDLARSYRFSGTVRLRVTFSKDGTVGAISVIDAIPFGLTQNAIAAALGITFEPQVENGIAVSVAKTVEYSFTMY